MNQYILYIWVGVMVLAAVVEVIQFRLYALWFALSALIAAIMGLFGLPIWAQITAFVLIPAITIPFLRPVLKRKWEAKMKKADADNLEEKTKESERR